MIAFDTNVLVYVADRLDPERHDLAFRVVDGAIRRQEAVFLPQSFAEFFHVTTRKLRLAPADACAFIEGWRAAAPVAAYEEADLMAAIEATTAHKLSFIDALLWATAERIGADLLVTEDQQDGRRLGRVTFVDPFAAGNRPLLGLG